MFFLCVNSLFYCSWQELSIQYIDQLVCFAQSCTKCARFNRNYEVFPSVAHLENHFFHPCSLLCIPKTVPRQFCLPWVSFNVHFPVLQIKVDLDSLREKFCPDFDLKAELEKGLVPSPPGSPTRKKGARCEV